MLIDLNGTWYHYCSIPERTVNALLTAESVGDYYNAQVRGQLIVEPIPCRSIESDDAQNVR
jgi:hypothetical protein